MVFSDSVMSSRSIYVTSLLVRLALMLIATHSGLQYGTDSANYLSAAQNLLDGNGLVVSWTAGDATPLKHFAAGYPLLIALLGANLTVVHALHVLVYMANIYLVLRAVEHAAQPSAMLIAALLILTTPPFLGIHTVLLTEAPFLFCMQVFLLLLVKHDYRMAALAALRLHCIW
jgi:hypothetical protein